MTGLNKPLICIGLLLLCLSPANGESTTHQYVMRYEVQTNGNALFLLESETRRRVIWTVNCRVPMQGCVARGQGILLWVDDAMGARLNSATGPGAKVSIDWNNRSRDQSGIFSKPLGREDVSRLSRSGTSLVIEENNFVTVRATTEGIDIVIDYLRWLKSNHARLARDARVWRHSENRVTQNLDSAVLERFRIATFQRGENPEILVPVHKPQIQFAIEGQKAENGADNSSDNCAGC